MASSDPYRITDPPPEAAPDSGTDLTGVLLWSLVVLGAGANLVASYTGGLPWLNVACGAVTLLGAVLLAARRLRGRR
ncbi:hypothetical protein [Streptomyces humi]|uniref:hypothetical protein n=1 Tax=Streptomyces humi TaxID=1428620 RepID=UPI00062873BE|nr:hypothetical protein [Streptomyces humi]